MMSGMHQALAKIYKIMGRTSVDIIKSGGVSRYKCTVAAESQLNQTNDR